LKTFKKIGFAILIIIVAGFLLPQSFLMPVEGCTGNCYDKNSFWYYPWGTSVTHKGVDIFAKRGTNVLSSTNGIVVSTAVLKKGGNTVLVLGPKWRLHYYAHLKEIKTSNFSWVNKGEIIGSVGTTGNAQGKEPHLHYSIVTIIPYLWRIDSDHQGWKKMFFLNPADYLK
jgi:peptidoglycan LD-endopeptidase LytH